MVRREPRRLVCLLALSLLACKGADESTAPAVASSGPDCARLQRAVCDEVGVESGVCELLHSSALAEARCGAMLRDLPQTLEDLRQMEQSRRPLSQPLLGRIHAADAPGFGAMDARVTVVVFSDYTCKNCLPLGLYLPSLSQRYRPDELRVAFRHHPSNNEQTSATAAEASLAASAQGRFLQYHECLYNNQHDLTLTSFERCAREVQLDLTRFKADMASHQYATQISNDVALGREALAGAPPYLFVNGQRYNGNRGVEGLRALIETQVSHGDR